MFTTTTTFNVTIEAIDTRSGRTVDKVTNPTAEYRVNGDITVERLLKFATHQNEVATTDAGTRYTVRLLGHALYYVYA